ncbi:ABC transporter ATP-binding protein [Testudinibacter sp. TR-2022]|uniref:ABC transporter ATP-binding protein n=1 Tax=Testudinibacter sp. TR-2022 TaxID=2585029 RepID=UPI001119375D|nr:ABC transporter ATP-binding protein [Testudinibacter sp. TR-2022]TNH04670.1 ABC transporter ATP-binding protein [Pasteurellaceae bacterium Phil31]TNH10123.1 ABC transporter ATP-binding protein [Testudinibacter sp. TR-2022]TNH12528.1 ABC transporter ATP-binding protein [Testudinibacter sp. TR-2022]TNH15551.1 ABC transporter ATP-binding protein [Testudinibacter sp. TR-2022]TNH17078.1 ABC transporter ATP-binding protein [Testudinibacter sp. TR-2022]
MTPQTYFNQATQHTKGLYLTYSHLLQMAGSQKGKLTVCLILSALSALVFGISIALLYPLFSAMEQDNTPQIQFYTAVVLLLLVLSIGLRMVADGYDTKGYANLAVYQLRSLLGDKLRKVPLAILSDFRSGELNSVLVQSVNEAAAYAFTLMTTIIYAITIPLATALALLFFDWRFGMVILIVFPLTIPLYLWRRKAFRRGFSILAEANERLKGEAVEFIQGLEVLKSTAQLHDKISRFDQVAQDVAVIQRIGTKKGEIPNLIITATVQISLLIILIFGLIWTGNGTASWLLLATVMVMIARAADVLNFFVQMTSLLEIFVISCEKLDAMMQLPELEESESAVLPDKHHIIYHNVSFAYPNQPEKVLKNINLQIAPNSFNAFVGSSGCGKTTLLRLLLRYADPASGTISIGGVDIRQLSQAQLMSMISVVFQDVYLFQDTILNNIRMAKPDADDETVIAAAKQAQCHDFIQRLPLGYQTPIADIGSNLSGGEKQRLAIARAILKDAPILILDEPTAALDTHNELAVQKALDKLVKNRTILVIAHRLSTVVGAHQISVLHNGQISEQGTHSHLLQINGRYAEFWRYQQQAEMTAERA